MSPPTVDTADYILFDYYCIFHYSEIRMEVTISGPTASHFKGICTKLVYCIAHLSIIICMYISPSPSGPAWLLQLMKAVFSYNTREDSPNPGLELELSFKSDDIITVYGSMVRPHLLLLLLLLLLLPPPPPPPPPPPSSSLLLLLLPPPSHPL